MLESDTKKLPLITIGVSAYNRKDYLKLSLNSLLNQTYPNCEIIVIDDGSTDGTDLMMKNEYPQIRYVKQQNGGDASAKNHAARIANGKYIVFNDSDDLFLPDSVERLFNALPADGNGISYGTYQTIDANGNTLPTKRKMAKYPSGKILEELLSHIIVNSCGVLIPIDLYLEVGGFDTTLKVAHDYDFFLKLAIEHNFYAIQEPVFLRRRHGSNLSSANYEKSMILYNVFEQFLIKNPDIELHYKKTVTKRKADLQNKLYREAKHEKLIKEAKFHAKNAFLLKPTIKSFLKFLLANFC